MANHENFRIREILFCLENGKIYLVSEWDETDKIRIVKFDLQKIKEFETFTVGLDAHTFQVDSTNENKFYFICKNVIYSQEFEIEEEEEKKGLGDTLLNSLNFFKASEASEQKDELEGVEEFFTSKSDLKFLKFERDMRHFFCDDLKSIKRYQTANKEVVNVYDEEVFNPTGMALSADESLVYRWIYFPGQKIVSTTRIRPRFGARPRKT